MAQKPTYEQLEQRVKELDKEASERKLAEEALQKAHDELERRVEEHTLKLMMSNKQLEQEIKERISTEEALRESEEKYRNLFENSAVGIDIATKSGKILESNNTMQKMMGYSTDELSHLNLAETYVNPKNREDFLRITNITTCN